MPGYGCSLVTHANHTGTGLCYTVCAAVFQSCFFPWQMVDTETSFLYAGALVLEPPLDLVAGVVGGHPFTGQPHTRSASLVGSLQLMIAPFPSQAFA